MNKENEYNQVLDALLADVDTDSDVTKRQAHARCLDYAKEHFTDDPHVNTFLAMAAERLGQMRVHLGVIQSMVSLPKEARLHLIFEPQGGPILTGNADGLRYLSEICGALSATETQDAAPAEHVHLREDEPPMFGNTFGLTIYHEPTDWFDRHAVPAEDTETEDNTDTGFASPLLRETVPSSVAAVAFVPNGPLPPTLLLTHGRLYRVWDTWPDDGTEGVWRKVIADGREERTHTFTLRDDAGNEINFSLDIDDPELEFFTHDDLQQVRL